MVAVITVWNDGHPAGGCNHSCYDAETKTCLCLCQGENHGVGLEQAELNAAISGEEWLRDFVDEHALDPAVVTCRILGVEATIPLLV